MRIAVDNRDKIEELLILGYSCKKVADLLGISSAIVKCVNRELEDEEKAKYTQDHLLRWLRQNWHWKPVPKPIRRTRSENGYRIVRKGEQGHLRTPYRPDGKFR